jgi:hypothetical protein
MTRGSDQDEVARRLKGRQLAIVSVVAAIAFMAVEFLGATFGWSNAVMGLLELSVAAVFVWIMVNAYMLWRDRQD